MLDFFLIVLATLSLGFAAHFSRLLSRQLCIVEPIRLFADASGDGNNQRPDILLRSPRGFGRYIILVVAVTGLDGQSRLTEDLPNRHLQVHYDQKMAKYGHIAEQNRFQFTPTIFSHAGQTHAAFKVLLREQIRHKIIITFEGHVKCFYFYSTISYLDFRVKIYRTAIYY